MSLRSARAFPDLRTRAWCAAEVLNFGRSGSALANVPGTPANKGVGKVVKWGRQVAFTEGELYDPQGRLLAKATGTAIPTPFANYKK